MGSPGSLISPAGLSQLAEVKGQDPSPPLEATTFKLRRDLGKHWDGVSCCWAGDVSGLLARTLNSVKRGLPPTSLAPEGLRARTEEGSAVGVQGILP